MCAEYLCWVLLLLQAHIGSHVPEVFSCTSLATYFGVSPEQYADTPL